MIKTRKILILGASGNIGSYTTLYAKHFFDKINLEEILKGGNIQYELIASGRRETDIFNQYGVPYISADLTKEKSFDKLPSENVYAVILLSASIPSFMNQYNGRQYIDSIILAGFNVLEYCRKHSVDRILFSQTVFDVAEYPHSHIIKSDDPLNFSYKGDHSLYVISKNAVIEMMKHYKQEYGIKNFIFRLPTIYSYSPNPYFYHNGKKIKRPLYEMIESAIKGATMEIWGDPDYAKDMVHVYDLAQMLCKAVISDVDGGIYNAGTGIPVTLEQQVRTIAKVFAPEDKQPEIKYYPEKLSGGGFLLDISKAREELGYEPQYDCLALFEDFKKEMNVQRFADLRASDTV